MPTDWMIKEVSNYLYGYLKDGEIKIDSFLQKANVKVDRLQDLLKLRFIINRRTWDFIKSLEKELTNIKSTTKANQKESYSEVRGEILWGETIQYRLATNPKDRFSFITQEAEKTFNTDENFILKEVLMTLYRFCFDDPFLSIFTERPWYKEVIKNRHMIEVALYKNVYIPQVEPIKVSLRKIEKVKSHRKKIYREAAFLLTMIRKIETGEFNEGELKEVLNEFFILPSNENVLFELYWVVQILKKQQNIKLYLMEGSGTKVASWQEGNLDVSLYHNSTGSKLVKFIVQSDELENNNNDYLKHKLNAFHLHNKMANQLFYLNKSTSYWQGRPDIIIEKVERLTGQLVEVLLGEVKNTKSINYASTGLNELLDYMHLAKNQEGRYLQDTNVRIIGLLCLGEIDLKQNEFGNIKVLSLLNQSIL